MRAAAAVIGAVALISLILLAYAWNEEGADNANLLSSIWGMAEYFTVLTNLIIGVVLLWSAIIGRWVSYSLLTASVLWIVMVGVVYHLLLAADHNPQGVLQLTNICHHTIVPLGAALIWVFVRDRSHIPWTHPLLWISWPALYGVYALVRGSLQGSFPYFFMDPAEVGWSGVALSQASFSLTFLGLGLALSFVSNRLRRII